MNIKKIKGVSLLEAMISISLLVVLSAGVLYYMAEKNKKYNAEIFGLEVLSYVKLVDNKVVTSNYYADQWKPLTAYGYPDFKNFMYNNFNSVGTACGAADGWVPIVDRSNNNVEQFKERSDSEKTEINNTNNKKLLDCQYFKTKYYYLGLTPQVRVKVDEKDKYIDSVDFIFSYEKDKDLNDNFRYIKKSMDFMRAQDVSENFGSHYYSFVNVNNLDVDLKPLQCFNLGKSCAMKASFRRNLMQDSIRVDGLNSIEQGIVSFRVQDYDGTVKSDLINGILKNCDKWSYNEATESWTKNNTFKCGLGMYEGSIVAGILDGNSTSKTIYLNQQCNKFNLTNTSSSPVLGGVPADFLSDYTHILEKDSKSVPCGIYEQENEYIVISDITHADTVTVASETDSKLEVYASPEMIAEDYAAQLEYDENHHVFGDDDQALHPFLNDFKKPSRSVVESLKDPSLSFTENTIRNVITKNLTIHENLIVNSNSSLPPEEVFTTGELEVLNSFILNQENDIDMNPALTQEQKDLEKRKLSYSTIKGEVDVDGELIGGNLIVGNEGLFEYDEDTKEYTFKENPENDEEIKFKNTGTPLEIALKIAEITAKGDIKVELKSEAKDNLKADLFQFVPNETVVLDGVCDNFGAVGSNDAFELFVCQEGKWESIVNNGGISAFNSNTCPIGWSDYNAAAGRSLVGTGFFDTLHAGVVRYKTGDKGGEAKHKLTIDEMPSHSHNRPIIEHICQACHSNLGLAKIATGESYWSEMSPTSFEGEGEAHENRSPFYAIKFCIKGNDVNFDYIEANIPVSTDIWVEFEPEFGDYTETGAKYACFKEFQVDNISDPFFPKTYEVEVCKQDQVRVIKQREMNTRTSAVRYTGMTSSEFNTVIVQESWVEQPDGFTECIPKGELYNCSEWDKLENEIDFGISFTKKRTCSVHEYRYKQKKIRNWITGKVKVVSQIEEECFPSPKKVESKNSVGKNVKEFKTAVSFEKQTPVGFYEGFRLFLAGSYNINSNANVSDYANLGIPITNDKGHTVMLKIRRQERAIAEGFTCEITLYAVNGTEARNNISNNGSTFNWINGFTKLRFFNAANSQIGDTVTLSETNVRGNYSYKFNENDVCPLTNTLYNNLNLVKFISIDDN